MEEKGTDEYFLYKGLKKPLVFKGLKGRFIYQGGGAFAGSVVIGIVLSGFFGLLGVVGALLLGGALVWDVFRRQSKGLYTKTKNFDEVFIVKKKIKFKRKEINTLVEYEKKELG